MTSVNKVAVIYNRFDLDSTIAASLFTLIMSDTVEVTFLGSDQYFLPEHSAYYWIGVNPDRQKGRFFDRSFKLDRLGMIDKIKAMTEATGTENHDHVIRNGVGHSIITASPYQFHDIAEWRPGSLLRSTATEIVALLSVSGKPMELSDIVSKAMLFMIERWNAGTIGDRNGVFSNDGVLSETKYKRQFSNGLLEVQWARESLANASHAIVHRRPVHFSNNAIQWVEKIGQNGQKLVANLVSSIKGHLAAYRHRLESDMHIATVRESKNKEVKIVMTALGPDDYIFANMMLRRSHEYWVNMYRGSNGNVIVSNYPHIDKIKLKLENYYSADAYQ